MRLYRRPKLSEFLPKYKKMLIFLAEKEEMTYDEEEKELLQDSIHSLRRGFFLDYFDTIFQYFYDFESNYGHMEDTTFFTTENHTKAIREFHGIYYLVDVKEYNSAVIVTDSPDNYPLHIMPMEGQRFPEFIIGDILIEKGY